MDVKSSLFRINCNLYTFVVTNILQYIRYKILLYFGLNQEKYKKKLLKIASYILKKYMKLNYLNSRINLVKNKVNWNILVTLGKKIKRDSISSVNENRNRLLK